MKKLLGVFLTLFSSVALATTTVPVQLLNPTGSSSGQAVVSTGVSSAPAWGGIGVNGIAAIAANTVLANATGSSASPTAFAMPSCSTSSSILQYTTNTGVTCSTTIWASPPAIGGTTPAAGKFTTLQATSTITPSTTAGIVGTTLGDNANAGSVGEILTNTGTSTGLTSGSYVNLAQVTLTAGDWDVTGGVGFVISAGATALIAGLNTVSNTNPGNFQGTTLTSTSNFGGSQIYAPIVRFNVSSSTTVFLGGLATFSSGTVSGQGFIRARRVR